MVFPNFFDDEINVRNHARNGRSTKSFRTLGHWDRMMAELNEGDYVFLQFGHNDSKQDDTLRYAPAYGAYSDNLRRFIDEVRSKGATPVLLTPVSRRWFKGGVLDENCHTDYVPAMEAVAKEKGVVKRDILFRLNLKQIICYGRSCQVSCRRSLWQDLQPQHLQHRSA